jgi:hypothetical protein
MSEMILRFESVNWIYLSKYQLLTNNNFVQSFSCMCSVVGWFVINELKGMWKEAVVKLTFALYHATRSHFQTQSLVSSIHILAEDWLDSPGEPRPSHCSVFALTQIRNTALGGAPPDD